MDPRAPLPRLDRAIAATLFVVVLAVGLGAAPRQGIHRDEAYYMVAGELYATYWERALAGELGDPTSDEAIRPYWGYNHEHPPLWKTLYGLSWRLFHRCECAAERAWHPGAARLSGGRHVTLPLFDWESTAFRAPTVAAFALLCALIYVVFLRALGGVAPAAARAGALAAALLTAAQPRAFFHAQTASFDLPAATLWILVTYAWWRALESPRPVRAGLGVGALYGLFLATKLQSFFLPVALGLHFVALVVLRLRGRTARWPNPWPLVGMATVGPLVLLGLWPWLWHDTVRRFGAYLGFHLRHVHYNFEYLGTNYNTPPYPWHEPLGMLVTTAPVVLLVLAAAGIAILVARWARGRRAGAAADPTMRGTLLLLAALVPVAPFLTGRAPIFGETKHWLATMPILALCAGVAVATLGARLVDELRLAARPRARGLVLAALVALAATPAVVETARSHPFGLSHYNALAGGAPGGADLGMNRQFWGYSVAGLLPWLERTLPPGAPVYLHDWNHDAYLMYLRDGRLRRDLTDSGMEEPGIRRSRAALVIHERHFNKYETMIWDAYQTVRPAEVLTLDGVPLVTVYTR